MTDYTDAENYVNDPSLELAWAMKAAERARIHMSLLINCDTRGLHLIKSDTEEEIYDAFRKEFPEMDVQKVDTPELKEGEMKLRWQNFCEDFKDALEDYNMGTLMRISAALSYSEQNTIVVPKVIHLAVEIARNREGVNERNKSSYTNDHNSNETSIQS